MLLCVCMSTARQISVSWPLREHICSEGSTSGSHISPDTTTEQTRRENKRGSEREGSVNSSREITSIPLVTSSKTTFYQSLFQVLPLLFHLLSYTFFVHIQIFIVSYSMLAIHTHFFYHNLIICMGKLSLATVLSTADLYHTAVPTNELSHKFQKIDIDR